MTLVDMPTETRQFLTLDAFVQEHFPFLSLVLAAASSGPAV